MTGDYEDLRWRLECIRALTAGGDRRGLAKDIRAVLDEPVQPPLPDTRDAG